MELAVAHRGLVHFRDGVGCGDNNEAEWLALLFAVELAIAQGSADVVFVGDSSVIIQQAAGIWPCRSTQLRPYHAAFQEAAAHLGRFSLRQVPRSKNLAGIALARRNLP